MGLGCFLWVPVSIGLGRRPTMLIATLVVLLAMLWAGEAGSFRSLVGAVCFLGLGEGLALSLVSSVSRQLRSHSLTTLGFPDGH